MKEYKAESIRGMINFLVAEGFLQTEDVGISRTFFYRENDAVSEKARQNS
jgi:hypothetical protein